MAKHVHAELMMKYAQDALETDSPWERWEFYNEIDKEWMGMRNPLWQPEILYRRKPKTRTVNGFTFEWEEGDGNGYVAHPMSGDFYMHGRSSPEYAFMRAKERNLLAKTKEMAIAHAKAMLGIDPDGEQTASYTVRSEIHGGA